MHNISVVSHIKMENELFKDWEEITVQLNLFLQFLKHFFFLSLSEVNAKLKLSFTINITQSLEDCAVFIPLYHQYMMI